LILAGIVAVAAALEADRASAGFIRLRDPSLLNAEKSRLVASVGTLDFDDASCGGASSAESAGAPARHSDENDGRRILQERFGGLSEDLESRGAESTPQPRGSSSTSAAVSFSTAEMPQATLITRLPTDMGPAFSNPPPSTPLRPPRRIGS